MNFRLVLTASMVGLVVGVLSILGVVRSGFESLLWLVLGVTVALWLAARAGGRYFLHGFLTGFIACILAALIQVVFFDRYLAANPKAAQSFSQLPASMSPRVIVTLVSPILAGVYGAILGLMTWGARKLVARNRAAGGSTA